MIDPKKKQLLISRQDPMSCPHCKRKLTALSGDAVPEEGDYNVCFYCMGMSVITYTSKGIGLRLAKNDREHKELAKLKENLVNGATDEQQRDPDRHEKN